MRNEKRSQIKYKEPSDKTFTPILARNNRVFGLLYEGDRKGESYTGAAVYNRIGKQTHFISARECLGQSLPLVNHALDGSRLKTDQSLSSPESVFFLLLPPTM